MLIAHPCCPPLDNVPFTGIIVSIMKTLSHIDRQASRLATTLPFHSTVTHAELADE